MFYDSSTNELWSKEANDLKWDHFNCDSQSEMCKVSVHNMDGRRGRSIILPDLSAYLICYIPHDKLIKPYAKLIGPRTKSITITREARRSSYILRIRPGHLGFDKRLHIRDLINSSVYFQDFFPELWEPLSRSLATENGTIIFDRMSRVIGAFNENRNPDKLLKIANLFCLRDIIKVGDAAKRLGISERYLRKIFDKYIGISPSNSFQIMRLCKSLEMKRMDTEETNWAGLAVGSGYYDQSHMIAEYQRFLGNTPEKLYFP